MAAFTYLCKKINISVAHNTITFYAINGSNFSGWVRDPLFEQMISSTNFIKRSFADHGSFHDDSFDKEVNHYHMQFTKNIHETELEVFLTILLDKHIIDTEEKSGCMAALRQAKQDSVAQFYDQLKLMEIKIDQLKTMAEQNPEDYQPAVVAAQKLYDTLKCEVDSYISLDESKKNAVSYEKFKTNCVNAVDEARSTLENHRGWKRVFVNLVAAIAGIGVFYLAAIGINYYLTNGHFLFFHPKTDAENVLDQCAKAAEGILRV